MAIRITVALAETAPADESGKLSIARFAVDESIRAVEAQLGHVDAQDLKTSFVAAASAALLAGLTAFAAAHPSAMPLDRGLVSGAATAAVVALMLSLKAWHPRVFKGTPSVKGLKVAVDGDELAELREMLASLEKAFGHNDTEGKSKFRWLERANLALGAAAVLVAAVVVAEFGLGK